MHRVYQDGSMFISIRRQLTKLNRHRVQPGETIA
jgi:hypothetical protein